MLETSPAKTDTDGDGTMAREWYLGTNGNSASEIEYGHFPLEYGLWRKDNRRSERSMIHPGNREYFHPD